MNCTHCGAVAPEDAAFCPSCGQRISTSTPSAPAPPKSQPPRPISSKTKGCLTIGGIGFAVMVLIGILAPTPKETEKNSVAVADTTSAATNSISADEATQTPEVESSPWSYSQDEDKVRGGTTFYASTTSTNSIAQDFPYDSHTTMTMTVRKSPAYGTDVILTISSGQMMCPSYDGCSGTVRFDNGAPEHVSFNGPEDNDSETIFLVGAKQFIAKLKKAKKVTMEKTLYQAGNPQFEFDVSGLKWNH